jgi:hypothetical protein
MSGGERLFEICSLVVLVSVALHGGSPMLLAQAARKRARREAAAIAGADDANVSGTGRDVSRPLGPAPIRPEAAVTTGQEEPREAPISRGEVSTPTGAEEGASCDVAAASCQFDATGETPHVGGQNISIDELRDLWRSKEQVTILDVRTERSIEGSDTQAQGAVRMPPDHVVERARELGLKQEGWLIAYCA